MDERDPRVDPAFLDLVRSVKGRERTVEFVSALGAVVYSTPRGAEHQCKLKSWRRWAQDGAVLRHGTNRSANTVTLDVDHETDREVNMLINRLVDGRADRGEMLGALAEYGLAMLHQGPGGPGCKRDTLMLCLERYRKRITTGNHA